MRRASRGARGGRVICHWVITVIGPAPAERHWRNSASLKKKADRRQRASVFMFGPTQTFQSPEMILLALVTSSCLTKSSVKSRLRNDP